MNYEVGKWYWFESSCGHIVKFSHFHNGELFVASESYSEYGTNCENWGIVCKNLKLATQEQIESCLKAYAVKNGYVKGAKIKSLMKYSYKEHVDEFSIDNLLVYENGKWAEIVKEEPKNTVTAGFFDTEEDLDHEMVKLVESCSGMPTYTREELKSKITQLSKMGFMASNFERSYGLPSQTIKHLFYAKCFSSTRINKVISALNDYHRDFKKIIEK